MINLDAPSSLRSARGWTQLSAAVLWLLLGGSVRVSPRAVFSALITHPCVRTLARQALEDVSGELSRMGFEVGRGGSLNPAISGTPAGYRLSYNDVALDSLSGDWLSIRSELHLAWTGGEDVAPVTASATATLEAFRIPPDALNSFSSYGLPNVILLSYFLAEAQANDPQAAKSQLLAKVKSRASSATDPLSTRGSAKRFAEQLAERLVP